MKVNTIKKLAVSTMAIAMGAALVGSISGSIAWYQYSTRSTVAYSGASAHCTENLQIRLPAVAAGFKQTEDVAIDPLKTYYVISGTTEGAGPFDNGTNHFAVVGTPDVAEIGTYYERTKAGAEATEWASDLRFKDVRAYIAAVRGAEDYDLRPVTTGALALNEAKSSFKKSPIYQYEDPALWGNADMFDYVELPLAFRVLDVDGEGTHFLDKEVYLTKLTMTDLEGNEDITNALRVGLDADYDATYSKSGFFPNVFGQLDLNNDGIIDTKESFDHLLKYTVANTTERDALTGMLANDLCQVKADGKVYRYNGSNWNTEATDAYCVYGENASIAYTTAADAVADDSDPYNITGDSVVSTGTSENGATITVRIYLEGWQTLGATPSAMWDAADYVGSSFSVSMRFSVEAHERH